eukprot:scaffold173554_cov35-Tisochrysis_lutea.AAC.3
MCYNILLANTCLWRGQKLQPTLREGKEGAAPLRLITDLHPTRLGVLVWPFRTRKKSRQRAMTGRGSMCSSADRCAAHHGSTRACARQCPLCPHHALRLGPIDGRGQCHVCPWATHDQPARDRSVVNAPLCSLLQGGQDHPSLLDINSRGEILHIKASIVLHGSASINHSVYALPQV